MSNAYLDLAELILRQARRPLSPREILAHAYVEGVVPSHLHGKTQEKTLQARLSEDISRLREESQFFRTNRARFFLREFLSDRDIPPVYKTEFLARPRRKDLRNERILAFDTVLHQEYLPAILTKLDLDRIFAREHYRYTTWAEIAEIPGATPVYSFVVFHTQNELLTHFVGQFNEENHPSKGFRSIGFGSVVRAQDSDLLYDAYHGIVGSGINELVYSLGLSRELAREARYEGKVHLNSAFSCADDRIGPHVRAVMSYRCPDNFLVSKASLSLNRLTWVRPEEPIDISEFDEVSQALWQSRRLSDLVRST